MANDLKEKTVEKMLQEIQSLLSHLHDNRAQFEASFKQVLALVEDSSDDDGRDELTGLQRRRIFIRQLVDFIREPSGTCGLLLIHIDHFKKINDTHGPLTGDSILSKVGELLRSFETRDCVIGRLIGEEFAVALRGSDVEVVGVAEFIRRGVEKLHGAVVYSDGKPSKKINWRCTVSVGMASTSRPGLKLNPTKLFGAADSALKLAQAKGRNQVAIS